MYNLLIGFFVCHLVFILSSSSSLFIPLIIFISLFCSLFQNFPVQKSFLYLLSFHSIAVTELTNCVFLAVMLYSSVVARFPHVFLTSLKWCTFSNISFLCTVFTFCSQLSKYSVIFLYSNIFVQKQYFTVSIRNSMF